MNADSALRPIAWERARTTTLALAPLMVASTAGSELLKLNMGSEESSATAEAIRSRLILRMIARRQADLQERNWRLARNVGLIAERH